MGRRVIQYQGKEGLALLVKETGTEVQRGLKGPVLPPVIEKSMTTLWLQSKEGSRVKVSDISALSSIHHAWLRALCLEERPGQPSQYQVVYTDPGMTLSVLSSFGGSMKASL